MKQKLFKNILSFAIATISLILILEIFRFSKIQNFGLETKQVILGFLLFLLPYILLQLISIVFTKDIFYLSFFAYYPYVPKEHKFSSGDYSFTALYALIIFSLGVGAYMLGWVT